SATGVDVGDRFRRNGASFVVAGNRSGAVCTVGGVGTVGPYDGDTGFAAGRYRVGHRRRLGRLGRAARVLQPITLWDRRLYRLFPVRSCRDGAGSGIRGARPGRRGHPPARPVARTPEESGRLPDLPVPGRLRPAVRDVTSTMARAAPLAGRARRLPG